MEYEKTGHTAFNPLTLLSNGEATENFLEGVRARHIKFVQETILEIAANAANSERLNHQIKTRDYANLVRYPDLPSLG